MPLLCVGERRSPNQFEDDDIDGEGGQCTNIWQEAPDSILLHIFSFLESHNLVRAAQTCKDWLRVALDESLWRALVRSSFDIDERALAPGKVSWREEYRRIQYHTPMVHSETLHEHTDEVLHVSFAHKGHLFSTTSKDATLRVWSVGYPTRLKYTKDFRALLGWDFTQFSCFNKSDTMVLVSSVKTTDFMDRRGYVAILSLIHDFEIIKVVTMDPSQLFGAWLDDNTFLGGCLHISLDRFATTVQIEAFEVEEVYGPRPVPESSPEVEETAGQTLFTFSSETASLIKFLTVASHSDNICQKDNNSEKGEVAIATKWPSWTSTSSDAELPAESNMEIELGGVKTCSRPQTLYLKQSLDCDTCTDKNIENIDDKDSKETVEDEGEGMHASSVDLNLNNSAIACPASSAGETDGKYSDVLACSSSASASADVSPNKETRNLIFVTGEFAVALHQLGFKNVSNFSQESASREAIQHSLPDESPDGPMVVNYSNNDIHYGGLMRPDKPDNLIDLQGHVTGLCLSEDQRYLFINCRPWIGEVDRTDPWATPDLSPNIEVRVIDLMTLQDMGVRYIGHKGFSPSTMCCFVFLDVSKDYVASGSEDAHGYLWDRHYQVHLAKFEHDSGVVNAVGFNPVGQEYLVTVSDDGTIKVWRSRNLMKKLDVCTGS